MPSAPFPFFGFKQHDKHGALIGGGAVSGAGNQKKDDDTFDCTMRYEKLTRQFLLKSDDDAPLINDDQLGPDALISPE